MSISERQIQIGTQHELEHTTSRQIARQIALDHLQEDSCYYDHLVRMEKLVKQGKWNPSSTERQRRFMCADYGRKKRGEKTVTGMTKGQLREFCMKNNPAKVISDRQALALAKKVITYGKKLLMHEKGELRHKNPIAASHVNAFINGIKQLDKYVVGSKPYITALAKAYEHLQEVKKAEKKKVA